MLTHVFCSEEILKYLASYICWGSRTDYDTYVTIHVLLWQCYYTVPVGI